MWQEFYTKWSDKAEVVAVAMDVQGIPAAKPYVQLAKAQYTNLVDSENLLSNLIGFKVVPNTFLMDEEGRYVRKASNKEEVETWVRGKSVRQTAPPLSNGATTDAARLAALERLIRWIPKDAVLRRQLADAYRNAKQYDKAESAYQDALALDDESSIIHFRYGGLLLELKKKEPAVQQFRRALELDPENWLIRKQIWAIEHPEKFYDGEIDWDWQRQQTR